MSKAPPPTVYIPIGDEEDIDCLRALGQAASAIDAVGVIAQKKDDSETLLKVALSWIELSEKLASFEREGRGTVQVEEDEGQEKPGFGFRSDIGES